MLPYEKSRAIQVEKYNRFEAEAKRDRDPGDSYVVKAISNVKSGFLNLGQSLRERRSLRSAH